MNNNLLKENCNNPNQSLTTSNDKHDEILFNLIEEIHRKFGFTRSKL